MDSTVADLADDDVPSKFTNVIVKREDEVVQIRSSINSPADIKLWMEDFGKNTKTSWIVRDSCSKGTKKLLCRKEYVCHHSKFKKSEKKSRKNYNCRASVRIAVKLTTASTRRRDKFVKGGLPAQITLNLKHSHTLRTAAALGSLRAGKNLRNTFEKYFNDGLSIGEAINFHKATFVENVEDCLANASLNPKRRTVEHWYDKWRELNFCI